MVLESFGVPCEIVVVVWLFWVLFSVVGGSLCSASAGSVLGAVVFWWGSIAAGLPVTGPATWACMFFLLAG
jgi:hypothetical protein